MISRILGVNFNNLSLSELITQVDRAIVEQNKVVLAFSNPEFLVEANKNEMLKNYLNNIVNYNVADGIGVVWASRFFGCGLKERVTGTDFLPDLYNLCNKKSYKIFFLGGRPGVAERARVYLSRVFSGDPVIGVENGFFEEEHNDVIIKKINDSAANVLMVCFGNPRQERWILENLNKINVNVIFGNGGALDFWSGGVKRAPIWVQKVGLEWLFRLGQDFSKTRILRQLKLIKFIFMCLFYKRNS